MRIPTKIGIAAKRVVAEKDLRSAVRGNMAFEEVLSACIEGDFIERLKGGYRLTDKGDVALRVMSVLHYLLNRIGSMSRMEQPNDMTEAQFYEMLGVIQQEPRQPEKLL